MTGTYFMSLIFSMHVLLSPPHCIWHTALLHMCCTHPSVFIQSLTTCVQHSKDSPHVSTSKSPEMVQIWLCWHTGPTGRGAAGMEDPSSSGGGRVPPILLSRTVYRAAATGDVLEWWWGLWCRAFLNKLAVWRRRLPLSGSCVRGTWTFCTNSSLMAWWV